jgi:hypothetical protein
VKTAQPEHDHYLCQLAAEGKMSKPCKGSWGVGLGRKKENQAKCPCRCHKEASR